MHRGGPPVHDHGSVTILMNLQQERAAGTFLGASKNLGKCRRARRPSGFIAWEGIARGKNELLIQVNAKERYA